MKRHFIHTFGDETTIIFSSTPQANDSDKLKESDMFLDTLNTLIEEYITSTNNSLDFNLFINGIKNDENTGPNIKIINDVIVDEMSLEYKGINFQSFRVISFVNDDFKWIIYLSKK